MAKKTTTNATTMAIVNYLLFNKYKVWPHYNGAVYNTKTKGYQKNPNRLHGVSDIIGFNRLTGQFIAVEIKTGSDKPSPEQIHFTNEVKNAGCIGLFVKSFDDFKNQFEEIKKINLSL